MYKIYDDAVDTEILKNLYSDLTGDKFAWYLTHTVKPTDIDLVEDYDESKYNVNHMAMIHLLINHERVNSNYAPIALELINSFCEKNNITHNGVLRAQFNLVFQNPCDLPCMPHVDNKLFNHGVLLFYINDSDGDTCFYDDNRNIEFSVTPKLGRVVVFDGHHSHSGGTPIKCPVRLAMNVNLLNMKWNNNVE
jgi:hypothetical protein